VGRGRRGRTDARLAQLDPAGAERGRAQRAGQVGTVQQLQVVGGHEAAPARRRRLPPVVVPAAEHAEQVAGAEGELGAVGGHEVAGGARRQRLGGLPSGLGWARGAYLGPVELLQVQVAALRGRRSVGVEARVVLDGVGVDGELEADAVVELVRAVVVDEQVEILELVRSHDEHAALLLEPAVLDLAVDPASGAGGA